MQNRRLELAALGLLVLTVAAVAGGWYYWKQLEMEFQGAAMDGDLPRVRALLARGVNVRARDYLGGTPLALAASNHHATVVEVLLDAGAKVNAVQAEDGSIPLTRALTMAPIRPGAALATVKVLLARGADPDHRPANGRSARDWARRWEKGLAVNPDPYSKVTYTSGGTEVGARPSKELTADLRALIAEVQRSKSISNR